MSQQRVTASKLNVRSSPQVANGNKVGQLSNGEMIDVMSSEGGWASIDYHDSNAFVSAQYLEPVAVEEAPAGTGDGGSEVAAPQQSGPEDTAEEPGWWEATAATVAGWGDDLIAWWDDVEGAAQRTVDEGVGWMDDVLAWWTSDQQEASPEEAPELDSDVAETVADAEPEQEEPAAAGYFSHPNAGNVSVSYGDNAVPLNATAEHLLKSLLASAGKTSGYVSSTLRTYADQARINYEQNSASQILQWYGSDVHATWVRYHNEGRSTAEYATYLEERDEARGGLISNHIPGYALDVAPHDGTFSDAVQAQVPVAGSGVRKRLVESKCTHVEFTFKVT